MSRYYFHSVTEDGLFEDDVGVEVEDSHLQREASRAIFELASEFVADGVLYFRVEDDVGRTVLELPLRAAQSLSH